MSQKKAAGRKSKPRKSPFWREGLKSLAIFIAGAIASPTILSLYVNLNPPPVTVQLTRIPAPAKSNAAGCALYEFDLKSGQDVARIDLRLNTDTPISDAKFTYGDPAFVAKLREHGVVMFDIGRDKSGQCKVFQNTGFMDSDTTIEKQPLLVRFHLDNPPDNFEVFGVIAMSSRGQINDPIFTRLSYGYDRLGITATKEIVVLPPTGQGLFYKIAGPHEPRTQTFTFQTPTPVPAATPLLQIKPSTVATP